METAKRFRRPVQPWSYMPRPWGGLATPRMLGGIRVGGQSFTLYVYDPDSTAQQIAAEQRRLHWRHSALRIMPLMGLMVLSFAWSSQLAPVIPGSLWVDLLAVVAPPVVLAVTIDVIVGRVLRTDTALPPRAVVLPITVGRRRVFKPDIPSTVHPAAVSRALTLVDVVDDLHEAGLGDPDEWRGVWQALWDVAGLSASVRASVGWPALIDKLDDLVKVAAARSI